MAQDKMQLARGRLGLYAGFWLALASKMQWEAGQPMGGVAMTDGRRVTYNLANINARDLGDVVFIALHEVGHPMLCHLTRRGNRNPRIYGAAIDCVLNKLLKKITEETPQLGMTVPKDALFGAAFGIPDDKVTTVEAVYDLLYKKCQQAGGGKGKGKGEYGPDGEGMPQFDEHGDPAGEDGKQMTPAQAEALEREWKVATQAAAVMAKQMGKLPGFMEEFIAELLKPKVDWKSQLWNAVTRIAKDESSYRRFNRRHLARGHYLPGMYSERVGALGYFVDTSGSISTEEFKQALGEMAYLLEEIKPDRIFFGQCDTKLHDVSELTPEDLPLPGVKVYGRGGTDMREAFEWACEHDHEIDAFILQTDGFVPPLDPGLHPNCPVIIIKTTRNPLPAGWDFPTVIEVEV